MQDIAASLTNSLSRAGVGGMLGNLPMNGNRITGMAPGVADTDAATMAQVQGIPVGAVIDYWGNAAPTGFMFAAGQEVSRTTYAELFAVIGTTAGVGNGSTTFNLPDYRGLVSAGREDMATPATTRLNNFMSTVLGAIFGSQSHTLTEAELAEHTHTGSTATDGAHAHQIGRYLAGAGVVSTVFSSDAKPSTVLSTEIGGAHSHAMNLDNTGSSDPHNNVQPTIITNKIIRIL